MTKRINDRIAQEYIDSYLECGRKVNYFELTAADGVQTYYYDELPDKDVDGYPISSDYELDGKAVTMRDIDSLTPEEQRRLRLRYYYMPYNHELYVGTTGSGKTTGCVEPQLRAIAYQRNKPHLFFTDPKGELYNRNAEFLKEQGYRLFLLNFKDLALSDRWNPLVELYDLNQKALHVMEQIKPFTPDSIPADYNLACPRSELMDICYGFNGFVYPDYEAAETAATFARDAIKVEIDSLLQQLANMFIKVQTSKDPTWEYGAQEAIKGIVYAMLENSASDPMFTRDMMTIKTMQDYYLTLRDSILTSKRYRLTNHPLLEGNSPRVLANLSAMFDNAENTMRSYCGVFNNCMREWFSGHILALTTGNTVELEPFDKPFAVFVVTRDYEKSDFQVAGLFIDWVYRTTLIATEEGRNHRPVHFILDEFGNIPEIRYFENKIATARSRNIWFHLAVQSYKQMDAVYGELRSCIIRDNCNSQVFLGSQNYVTKDTFSKDCGKHNIPTLRSVYSVDDHQLQEVRLVPISDLDNLKAGQAIIKRLHAPIIFGEYIRSYVAGKIGTYTRFNDANGLVTLVPHNYTSFMSPAYTYHKVRLTNSGATVGKPNPFRF